MMLTLRRPCNSRTGPDAGILCLLNPITNDLLHADASQECDCLQLAVQVNGEFKGKRDHLLPISSLFFCHIRPITRNKVAGNMGGISDIILTELSIIFAGFVAGLRVIIGLRFTPQRPTPGESLLPLFGGTFLRLAQ